MIRNPFVRKPQTPFDKALAVVDDVRSEAAQAAAAIRDAASKAADALGEPQVPVPGGRRLPAVVLAAAGGLGVAIAIKARAGGREPELPPVPPRRSEPATATAAKATTTAPSSTVASTPASDVGPEEPKEPKAETRESGASST